MPELTPQERLQPSLLDRLTDDESHAAQESRQQRVFSARRLREVVLRDLAWLLNTTNLGREVADYPQVASSVVNFGIPDLAGVTASMVDPNLLERAVREAILRFEPRILARSLRVRTMIDRDQMNQTALVFEIEGELWGQPIPQRLFLKTEVDLETGQARVYEAAGEATRARGERSGERTGGERAEGR
jgi:type VI secretion system protein ImpF